MDPRIEELRHAIAEERTSWTGQRWRASQSVRTRVVALVEDERARGASLGRMAATLGLHPSVLRRWLGRRRVEDGAAATFRRVTLCGSGGPGSSSLVLVTPGGYRLEGLDLSTALTVLQAVA
ncbi:MAG: hypothetical protein AB2L07_18625 [Thermoanaerobaculaceae bacterium]